MSKDVVIAGVIVAACLGLVTVAFVVPKQKTVTPEIAKKEDPVVTPSTPGLNDPLGPTNSSDPFFVKNDPPSTNPFPPLSEPNNPFNQQPGYPNNKTGLKPPGTNPFPPFQQPPMPIEPPPVAPVLSEAKSHVVATGETLGEISQKYYGTSKHWKKIAEANKVDANDLKAGQKLVIPAIETPAVTAPIAPVLAGGERSYTVQKNDSYYSIAKKELGSAARWKELEKLNNVPADELHVGKVIKLPAKAAAVEALPAKPDTPASTDANTHVVKAGETLSDVSKQHYGTTTKWKDIVKANPGIDPEGLKVGQKLKLPEIAGTPTTPSTPSGSPSTGSTPAPSTDNPAATYTVKAGEYLEDIAQSQLGSRGAWKKLIDANPGLDAKKLRIGQKLVIPGKSAPAETKPTAPGSTKPKPSFGTPTPATAPAPGFGTSGFPTSPSSQPGANNRFAPLPDNGFPVGGSAYPPASGTPPSGPGSSFPVTTPPPVNDNPFAVPPAGNRSIP